MFYDVVVRFGSGKLTDDGSDPESLLLMAQLLVAKANGLNGVPVSLEGGRQSTVGDITDFSIEVHW